MRFALDTNILVYAADSEAGDRHRIALDIVRRADGRDCVLALQALAELFRTLTAKRRVDANRAALLVHGWRDAFEVRPADEQCLAAAIDAVALHHLSFWDAMMWATVRRAGCRMLITEDGQNGRILGGVTFVDPFADGSSALIEEILAGP